MKQDGRKECKNVSRERRKRGRMKGKGRRKAAGRKKGRKVRRQKAGLEQVI